MEKTKNKTEALPKLKRHNFLLRKRNNQLLQATIIISENFCFMMDFKFLTSALKSIYSLTTTAFFVQTLNNTCSIRLDFLYVYPDGTVTKIQNGNDVQLLLNENDYYAQISLDFHLISKILYVPKYEDFKIYCAAFDKWNGTNAIWQVRLKNNNTYTAKSKYVNIHMLAILISRVHTFIRVSYFDFRQ